jgi:hypothetical protein
MWWSTLAGKLERAQVLDPVRRRRRAGRARRPPARTVKDALHGRWLGHAVHPLLVPCRSACGPASMAFDLTGDEKAAQRLVGPRACCRRTDRRRRSRRLVRARQRPPPQAGRLVHAASNSVTAALYAASWLARSRGDHARGRQLSCSAR